MGMNDTWVDYDLPEELVDPVRDAFQPWQETNGNAITTSSHLSAKLALKAVQDNWMKINGKWYEMECFCQYRQRSEYGRIEVAQRGDCWMDGRYLWRIAETPENQGNPGESV